MMTGQRMKNKRDTDGGRVWSQMLSNLIEPIKSFFVPSTIKPPPPHLSVDTRCTEILFCRMIHCIFFAIFDNDAGSKILYQHPEGYIENEVFETYSEYFITKQQLCGQLFTFTTTSSCKKKLLFMGIPQCIEGQYDRNALLFNIVFVFEMHSQLPTSSILPTVSSTPSSSSIHHHPNQNNNNNNNNNTTTNNNHTHHQHHHHHQHSYKQNVHHIQQQRKQQHHHYHHHHHYTNDEQNQSSTSKQYDNQVLNHSHHHHHNHHHHNHHNHHHMKYKFHSQLNVEVYKPILRKLTYYLRSLEIESQFLYNSHYLLKDMIPKIMNDLNTKRETVIPVDDANTISLRLIPTFLAPSDVASYEVPIPIRRDLKKLANENWDLTLQQIIPHIDGINFVKKIATKTGINIELVKQGVRHLLYYGYVKMIDLFQYSNMYALKSKDKILQLFRNKQFQNECLSMCEIQSDQVVDTDFDHSSTIDEKDDEKMEFSYNEARASSMEQNTLSIRDVISLYCKMKPGIRLKDILDPTFETLNHRALITFGLLRGIIVRIHEYPILELNSDKPIEEAIEECVLQYDYISQYHKTSASVAPLSSSSSISRTTSLQHFPTSNSIDDISSVSSSTITIPVPSNAGEVLEKMRLHLDGKHCIDEICCEFGMTRLQLFHYLKCLGNHCSVLHY